jgi:hypothetical protein
MRSFVVALVMIPAVASAESKKLTLDEVIAKAVASPRVQVAERDRDAAAARVNEADAARWPRFKGTAFATISPEIRCVDPECNVTEPQNFAWQFAGSFQEWAGRWNEMPVDAHMLIALSAPRPVFLTGGTADQWADPVGMFQAAVAAGPIYRLLGRKDLGTSELPPLDTALTRGDLGWHYHTGGHAATPADWKAFLEFLGKYF